MSSSDRSCSGTSGTSGSCCSAIVFWSQRCNDFVDLLHLYTGCPIKKRNGGFQYIASGKLSIFLRHRIKYFPQKRMTPKSLNLMK